MVELLGIRMHPISGVRHEEYGTHCMIDTQPETGNYSIPDDLPIAIAIDHHPTRPDTRKAAFTDVRTEFGATSTMMFYYLKAAGLDLPTKLATALLIGIKSDTRGLEREASEADLYAYLEIFPRADLTLMARIESPRIPQRYFEAFHEALEVSALYDGVVMADMGAVEHPDMVAEMADFFIPLDGADYALVMGRNKGRLYLSLRTRSDEHDAGADRRVDGWWCTVTPSTSCASARLSGGTTTCRTPDRAAARTAGRTPRTPRTAPSSPSSPR